MAKESKCAFGIPRVEYVGHFISKEEIATDPRKVEGIKNWPIPTCVRNLTGFLGMAGYYREFVEGYVVIAKPLTQLLRKGQFSWDDEASISFEQLREALTMAPVLGLPNLTKTCVMKHMRQPMV